jgi:hypothetical protein
VYIKFNKDVDLMDVEIYLSNKGPFVRGLRMIEQRM